jgi:hypothetical protein
MLTPPIITVGRMIRRMPAKKRDSYVIDDLRLFENGATISAQLPKASPGTLRAGAEKADVFLRHVNRVFLQRLAARRGLQRNLRYEHGIGARQFGMGAAFDTAWQSTRRRPK